MGQFSYMDLGRFFRRVGYFTGNHIRYFMPDWMIGFRLDRRAVSDKELEEIDARASYYVRLSDGWKGKQFDSIRIADFKYPRGKDKHLAYFFDLYPYVRKLPPEYRFAFYNEDMDEECGVPTFVKSRPVCHGATNSVLCRLNSLRHFRFVKDHVPYRDKSDIIVSRFNGGQPWRNLMLEKYFGNDRVDFGQINRSERHPEWEVPYMSIPEQLKHKFIMCVRGNDVSTSLKWVMSSNSIAVMPRPTVESWFMEGLLRPDCHYLEIKPDYSDLLEKVDWLLTNPDIAEDIIHNANEWTMRFRNREMESLIMNEVVRRYFEYTGQEMAIVFNNLNK